MSQGSNRLRILDCQLQIEKSAIRPEPFKVLGCPALNVVQGRMIWMGADEFLGTTIALTRG
jgi:hypothetical protein